MNVKKLRFTFTTLATLLLDDTVLFNSAKFLLLEPGPGACKDMISSQSSSYHRCQHSKSIMLYCSGALPVRFSKQRLKKYSSILCTVQRFTFKINCVLLFLSFQKHTFLLFTAAPLQNAKNYFVLWSFSVDLSTN